MKNYCVVYMSKGGMHYRYRCQARNRVQAKAQCIRNMGCTYDDIYDVYVED